MPNLLNLPLFTEDGDIHVVIETPRGRRVKSERNDRVFAVPLRSHSERALKDVQDLTRPIQEELEKFFIATEELEDKETQDDRLGRPRISSDGHCACREGLRETESVIARLEHGPFRRRRCRSLRAIGRWKTPVLADGAVAKQSRNRRTPFVLDCFVAPLLAMTTPPECAMR
jgi:hypothetical protein